MAAPASCGDAIEVPEIAWKSSPGGPSVIVSAQADDPMPHGESPARICTPGAVTSGLMKFPPGPRAAVKAITSPRPLRARPAGNEAVVPEWPNMNAANADPSARCTAGSQCVSVRASNGIPFQRTRPTAPPWRTLKPWSTRLVPPASQATILPVNMPGGAGAEHSGSKYGASLDSSIGAGPARGVIDAPSTVNTSPLLARTV